MRKRTPCTVLICLALSLTLGACSQPQPTTTLTPLPTSFAAKNVILLVGDGRGYNQLLATDYYRGAPAVYEDFPVQLGVTTYPYLDPGGPPGYDPVQMWQRFDYCLTSTSTDSAAAATAMATGVKTYSGAIGVDHEGNPVRSVTETAELLGKATGVVTTVPWSHATPAAFVAHVGDRGDYARIARQMIEQSAVDVIMGAGNPGFDDDGRPAGGDAAYVGGDELWADLSDADPDTPSAADADGDGDADPWTLVQTKAEFEALAAATSTPTRVCGTAQVNDTLQQGRGGDSFAAPYVVPLDVAVPDLATMVEGALNVLDEDPDGFFLMAEGGAIDWAGHAHQTGRMIEEQAAFDDAVRAVVDWVLAHGGWTETLVIVTSDHETGMLWGPGAGEAEGAAAFSPIVDNGEGELPGVSWSTTGHTNQLVPLYANGPGSETLAQQAESVDPVRGRYIDNTEVARLILGAL